MRAPTASLLVVLVLTLVSVGAAAARQIDPVVRGLVFFSPTCPHCEYVIQEFLPPLYDEHGGPWDLVFDTSLPEEDVAYFLLTNGTPWLTFAEAFIIHAICARCIGSALVIGALMWLTVPEGIGAWRRIAPASDVEELAA